MTADRGYAKLIGAMAARPPLRRILRLLLPCLLAGALAVAVPARAQLGPRPGPSFAPADQAPQYPRPRPFDVVHTVLDLRFDWDAEAVEGTATHRVTPYGPGLDELRFDQHRLKFRSVTLAGGDSLAWRTEGDTLAVTLDRTYAAGETLTVTIAYRAEHPAEGLYFNRPDRHYPDRPRQIWTQGEADENHFWFPCVDDPDERMTVEEIVTVADGLTVVGNGVAGEPRENGDGTATWHYRLGVPAPTYLISLVVGDYKVLADAWDGIPVLSYVRPALFDEAARSFDRTADMVRILSTVTGIRYPYPVYRQTEVENFLFGGMENLAATTLTVNTLHPAAAAPDYSSESLVSHELAHQWWGDYVTTRSWAGTWLNEGFADYFETVWYEFSGREDLARWTAYEQLRSYLRSDHRYRRPLVTRYYSDPDDMFDGVSYSKGSWVLRMLRHEVGDSLFWAGLRRYVARHGPGSVETGDLREAMAAVSGKPLDRFFDQWVFQGGHPELRVGWEWDGDAGLVHLTVRQTQTVDALTPLFRATVDVDLTGEGWTRRLPVTVDAERGDYWLPAPSRPDLVEFDRDETLVKSLDFPRETGELVRQLRRSPAVISRARAAAALGKKVTEASTAALREALLDTTEFYGVRGEAADALGGQGTEAAREALRAGLALPAARVRGKAAAALGRFGDDDAVAALRRVAGSDPVPGVAEAAVTGIGTAGKAGAESAREALTGLLSRRVWRDMVRREAIKQLGALKEPEAIAAVRPYARAGVYLETRREALTALGSLGGALEEKDPRRTEIRRLLEAALTDPLLQVRTSAVRGLGRLGDPEAAPALERLAGTDDDRGLLRSARETAADLRSGRQTTEAEITRRLDELGRSSEELQQEVRRLERRLEAGGASGKARGETGTHP